MDQPSDTIASFKGLGSNKARGQFLHDLIPELSPYERRELRDILNQETHRTDFISSLPLELVHIVIQYLDVSELFSLRRVSRCWHQRLASHDICQTILRRDFLEETAFVESNDLDPVTQLYSKAQQRHAFRTGRPYSKATFPIKLSSNQTPPGFRLPVRYLDYHYGKLAWVDFSSGTATARIRNLANGRDFSIIPGNREDISQLKISDTLVAVITILGVCHVFDHRTEEEQSFQLPSLPTVRMSVAARLTAVVVSTSGPGFASVLLRNFDTQKTSILEVSLGSDSVVESVVLHPDGDAFYIVTRGRLSHPRHEPARSSGLQTEFLKFNLEGEMTLKRECWANSEWILDHWDWGFGPTGSGSHCIIPLGTRYVGLDPETGKTPIYEDHYIDYDMRSDRVVKNRSTRRVREGGYGSGQSERSGPLRQNMRWRDMSYHVWYKSRRLESLLVHNLNDTSPTLKTEILDIDKIANSEKRSARIMLGGDHVDDYWLVGDERLLVMINLEEVQVWCFEEKLMMPGEEPHYRTERTRRAETRAAERRLDAMETRRMSRILVPEESIRESISPQVRSANRC